MSSFVYSLNVAIDIFALAISVVGLIAAVISSRINRYVKSHFIEIFVFLFAYVYADLGVLILRGTSSALNQNIIRFALLCEYLFPCLLAYKTSIYLLEITVKQEDVLKKLKWFYGVLLFLHIGLLVIAQFTGLYYYVDNNNYYQRSTFYPLSYLWAGIMLLSDIYVLMNNRFDLSSKQKLAFWTDLILPLLGMLMQVQFYGINYIVISSAVAGISMFVLIVMDQTERNIKAEVEMERIKSSLLLGQISPHFIFNSLMTIQDLCYSDANLAAKAIGDFSLYLRRNMEDLTSQEMIPFEKELEFIREYLKLERLDQDRYFKVEYDLEVTDFLIPTLTFQPVVENAVNYGALTCPKGKGLIWIYTKLKGDNVEIRVWNNADEIRSLTKGQKQHRSVAIENLKTRLQYYCGGTFEITVKEKEATAILRLPYLKVKQEESCEQ